MRRTRPAGKSLLEAIVMISLLSIIMGLSATSLASLFRLRHTITRDAEQARSIDRLAMRLRTDAHEVASASVDNGCVLSFADGHSVQYTFTAPRIVREVRRDEQIVHRDSFSVPRHTTVAFESDSVGSGSLVRVVIEPEATRLPPKELPRSATIEAAVGIHGALATSGREP